MDNDKPSDECVLLALKKGIDKLRYRGNWTSGSLGYSWGARCALGIVNTASGYESQSADMIGFAHMMSDLWQAVVLELAPHAKIGSKYIFTVLISPRIWTRKVDRKAVKIVTYNDRDISREQGHADVLKMFEDAAEAVQARIDKKRSSGETANVALKQAIAENELSESVSDLMLEELLAT